MMPKISAREAAYIAVLAAYREEAYVSDSLELWEKSSLPTRQDLHFAWEIAHGTVRMRGALDYLAKQCREGPLMLKIKERALLHTALYQFFFMSRVPLYAIVDETVTLARKQCHSSFANFLNAILRKLDQKELALPQGDSIEALSARYSYPPLFVRELLQDYGLEKAKTLLELQNSPPQPMARLRSLHPDNRDIVHPQNPLVVRLTQEDRFADLATRSDLYIQNITPPFLIWKLAEGWKERAPGSILDLCASPGGKLLALHDRFPASHLSANDISEEKLARLNENCSKYHLKASLSCSRGEEYAGSQLYDLVVLDVPCSNSGVLNKRPEARWRLGEEQLQQLEATQLRLLDRARHLIAPGGEIWFMTCSILKRENEALVARACERYGLKVRLQLSLLPNELGWEGGFAAALI